MLGFIINEYMDFDEQMIATSSIRQIKAIVSSVPDYVEWQAYKAERGLEQSLASDLLANVDELLSAGQTRSSGVIAGVVLERQMKLLCDKLKLKYDKSDRDIGKLNSILSKGAYDASWKMRVNWMYLIRNKCAHDAEGEPTMDEVERLISEVRQFFEICATASRPSWRSH